MKGYWHFPALSVVFSFLMVCFHSIFIFIGFAAWLMMLYLLKRIGKLPVFISLTAFFFFHSYIPSLMTPEPIEDNAVTHLSGTITGFVHISPQKVAFTLKETAAGTKLQVIYFPNSEEAEGDYSSLVDGAFCSLKGELQLPDKSRNPGQFDYQKFLLAKGISYQYVIPSIQEISCDGSSVFAGIYKLRSNLMQYMNNKTSPDTAAWISALVLGDDSLLDPDIVELFRKWSLSHILAISGLHIGLVTMFMYFILIKFGIATKEKAQWIMLFFLPCYALIAGGEPSVWRASLMVMLFIGLNKLKISYSVTDVISMVFLLLILQDKFIVYQIGFQFSFLVTFGLLLSGKWLKKSNSSFQLGLRISFVAQMIILPLQIHYFYTFQPLSILLNGIVVPYFSLFVIPLLFLVFILSPFLGIFTRFLDFLFVHVQDKFLELLTLLDQWMYYPFSTGDISLTISVIYYILFLVMMYYIQSDSSKAVISGIILTVFIAGIALRPYFSPAGSVTMLDIGQGDAIMIELPYRKAVIMIDAGEKVRFGEEKPSDKNYLHIIKPYLLSKGITEIDAVILSHADMDHIGSVPFMLNDMNIKDIMISEYFDADKLALFKNHTVTRIPVNSTISIADQEFQVLSPQTEKTTPNENSLVLYTNLGGTSFLFTGDTDKKSETEFLDAYPELHADVLKVAHHGSDTSTSMELLENIQPSYGLISVGRKNSYGHPSENVMQRLKKQQTLTFRTDEDGAVIFRFQHEIGTFSPYLP